MMNIFKRNREKEIEPILPVEEVEKIKFTCVGDYRFTIRMTSFATFVVYANCSFSVKREGSEEVLKRIFFNTQNKEFTEEINAYHYIEDYLLKDTDEKRGFIASMKIDLERKLTKEINHMGVEAYRKKFDKMKISVELDIELEDTGTLLEKDEDNV